MIYEELHVTQLKVGDRITLNYGCMFGTEDAIVRGHYSDQWGMHARLEILGGANDGATHDITNFSSKAIGWSRT